MKKKRTDCEKKPVKKDWIENLVISQTMKLVNDEETVKAIAAMLMEEQILFYLHKFRVLDMSKQSHKQRLIDTFINRIYLYDDKLVITFNHKDGAQTITLTDIETAFTEQENGLDLVSSAVPRQDNPNLISVGEGVGLFLRLGESNG